jgi:hypothetical protein
MPTLSNPSYVAGAPISPCRFVTMTPSIYSGTTTPTPADFTIWPAAAGTSNKGDRVIGVSQEGTGAWNTTTAAAAAGDQVRIHGPGEVALVECGGDVTAGAWVKSNASGQAIVVSQDDDHAAGIALQAGASGTKVQIYIHPFSYMTQ